MVVTRGVVAGRFPLYTDADIKGALIKALRSEGWDIERAIDTFDEGEEDDVHFTHAAREGRVFVGNDKDQLRMAIEWLESGRPFPGLIWWPKTLDERMRLRDIVDEFEGLAEQDDPLGNNPIYHVGMKRRP